MTALRITLLIEETADGTNPTDVERIDVGLVSGDYDDQAKRLIGRMVEHVAYRLRSDAGDGDDV